MDNNNDLPTRSLSWKLPDENMKSTNSGLIQGPNNEDLDG